MKVYSCVNAKKSRNSILGDKGRSRRGRGGFAHGVVLHEEP